MALPLFSSLTISSKLTPIVIVLIGNADSFATRTSSIAEVISIGSPLTIKTIVFVAK